MDASLPGPTTDPTAPPVPGYLLDECLGAGASGRVWAGTRVSDGARVAVKVVPLSSAGTATVAARELGVLARAQVDGLVGFHEAVTLDRPVPSLAVVLDLLDGGSLASAVAARGHLSVGESVTVLAPVARTLAGLHALGVVHGDVSPGNVLLRRDGRPLLADLGVATVAGEPPGDLYGTEGFVAPEVLGGGQVGAASDVYAVGALAWWCVTGRAPGPASIRPPIEEASPGLPASWRDLTLRALSGDPRARPSAAELALGYFDSAPCEPLRLRVGTDETSLLTQRLRGSGAGGGAEAPAGPAAAGPRARVGPSHRVGRGLARIAGTVRRAVGRAAAAGAHAAVRIGWRVPSGAALAVVLVVAGWSLVTAGSHQGASRAGDAAARSAPRTGAPADPAGPVHERRAPSRDVVALMTALARERAAVMNSGSTDDLAELDAEASEALAEDAAAARAMAGRGERYAGVVLSVRRASLVSVSASTAVVDAAVDTAAYEVVSARGTEAHAQVVGPTLRFTLVWAEGRWKVRSVRAAGAAS